ARVWTNLPPIKPVAPVIRIRSSLPMMLEASFSDIRVFDQINSKQRQQLAQVVTKLYQAPHESVLPQDQQKGKGGNVERYCNQRFGDVQKLGIRLRQRDGSAKQGSLQQE